MVVEARQGSYAMVKFSEEGMTPAPNGINLSAPSARGLIIVLLSCTALLLPPKAFAQSSMSIVVEAWDAFNQQDYARAIAKSDECIGKFSGAAQKMQGSLKDFPTGTNDQIHAYYALNDVATAHYIKAESLRKSDRATEAAAVYQDLLDKYAFGQCWDPRGWFWKPAVVAREKLQMIKTGKYYDFGDYSSMTLMVLAWKALDEKDLEAVLVFTNKCIELYGEAAEKMQSALKDFPAGTNDEIHAYYALNDVATAYFIQGEAYFKSDQMPKAKEAYQVVIDRYPFAQCWDPRGWFWRVAEGSKEKIKMIDTGLFMDFWDYTSDDLVTKAWQSMDKGDLPRAVGYADKAIQIYAPVARKQQATLTDYPQGSDAEIFKYWALNDVATAYYIKGEALMHQHQNDKAKEQFEAIVNEYSFAQCWDPRGWWWKPITEANRWLKFLQTN